MISLCASPSSRCLPCPVVSCALSNQSGSYNDAQVWALTIFTAHCGFMLVDDFGSMRVGLCVTGRAAELMTDAKRQLSFLFSASVGGRSAAMEPPTQKRVRFTPVCSPNELQSPSGITHLWFGRGMSKTWM